MSDVMNIEALSRKWDRKIQKFAKERQHQRELVAKRCEKNYPNSYFYSLTGIEMADFFGGDGWKIASDIRYNTCNTIHELGLSLEAISVGAKSCSEENEMLYYYIYKGMVVVTHPLCDIHSNKNKYFIDGESGRVRRESEFCGFESKDEYESYKSLIYSRFIREEHRTLPLLVIYTDNNLRNDGRPTDTLTEGATELFYRKYEDLKKIFV